MSDERTHVIKRVWFNRTAYADPGYMRLGKEDGQPIWTARKESAVTFTFREAALFAYVLNGAVGLAEFCIRIEEI